MECVKNPQFTLYDLYDAAAKENENYQVIYHNGEQQYKLNHQEFTDYVKRVSNILQMFSSPNELIGCLCNPDLIQPILMISVLKNLSAFTFLNPKTPLVSLCNLQKYVTIRIVLAELETLKAAKFSFCGCWKIVECIPFVHTSVNVLQLSDTNCTTEGCCKWYRKKEGNVQCNQDLAYVIQTSGTTGEPKVVQVPHQCIVPNIIHLSSLYESNSNDVILLVSPSTFDPSVVDVFLSFTSSATLVIVPDNVKMVPKKLCQVITECGVSILQATPSLIQSFGDDLLQKVVLSENSPLRILSLGGEKCPPISKLCTWKSKGNRTIIYNLYGLTELSCWASFERICFSKQVPDHNISLGKPLLDTEIEIRDEDNEIIQEGHGQLFIGGCKRWCVVDDELWPLESCRIMRSTGDWVYMAKSGEIFFEGRKDSLIKHNGKKVVLDKLGSVIEGIQSVARYSLYFDNEASKLYVFIVLNSLFDKKEEKTRCAILQNLRNSEPNLPVIEIIFIPFIPITSNGKSDNKRMHSYVGNSVKRKYVADEQPSVDLIEKYLLCLWKEYTGCKMCKGEDNFILNGGDSVSAVQCALEIEWKFKVSLPNLVDMLLNSTFQNTFMFLKKSLGVTTGTGFKTKKQKSSCLEVCNNMSPALLRNENYSSCSNAPINRTDNVCFRISNICGCRISSRRGTELKCNCQKCSSLESFCETGNQEIKGLVLKEKFKYNLKKCIDATVCCCEYPRGNIVAFIGSHSGCFVAVDVQTGAAVWVKNLPDRIESSAIISPCGLFVFVGCYDHHLYCFDAQNGDLKWKYRTGAEVKSSPVVSPNKAVYVGSHDQHFYAVDINNGELIWKAKISNGSIFSSPCYCCDPHLICVATLDGIITALNPVSGDILWQHAHGKPIFSSPIIVNSSIFVGSVDGSMLHFKLDGNLISAYPTNGPVFSSALNFISLGKSSGSLEDLIVFGSHDGMVYCYSVSGISQWKFCCGSPVYSTPFPFFIAGNYYIAVSCTKGTLYILNAVDGNAILSVDLPGEVFSSPVVLNEYLVVGCRDNNTYCFEIHYDV